MAYPPAVAKNRCFTAAVRTNPWISVSLFIIVAPFVALPNHGNVEVIVDNDR